MSLLSYSRNTNKYNFIFETIGSRMRQWGEIQPNKTALVVHMSDVERSAITYGELYEKATRLAKYFVSVGVKPGDKIAVFLYNSTEWLITSIAGTLVGAVSVNSFTFASQKDLDMLRTFGCKVLVADMRDAELKSNIIRHIETLRAKGFCMTTVAVGDINGKPTADSIGIQMFNEVLLKMTTEDIEVPNDIDPEDITACYHTSGSTGVPKFVPYSHSALINTCLSLYTEMGLENEDVFFSDRPMGYIAGYPVPIIVLGCTFVTLNSQSIVRDSLSGRVCDIIQKESVTCGYFPPYMIYDLDKLKQTSPKRIPYLKAMVIGGQRLSKNLLERFREYSAKPCLGYGCTEMNWVTFSAINSLPSVDDDLIGTLLPATEIKIVDQHGRIVPANTNGEICVRGHNTTRKYLTLDGGMVDFTGANGWFHTGDIGYMIEDGKNFCIKGRTLEMIKRSNTKIFPASIEKVLSDHPAVGELAVVGIPDERMYQEVCACVTVKAGKQLTVSELVRYSAEKFQPELAPDGNGLMPGHFFIFDTFPRLPSQKVNRLKLAEMAEKLASSK